jgi:single-stranded-DNA-specific exonuclease
VNIEHLAPMLDAGAQLLLTCDTGIASPAAVAYAEDQGVPVIVTDHHHLPEVLPNASVIINPRLLEASHPLATLPGVGVAYKLAEALYDRVGRSGAAEAYLDLVALGIVADVATQRADTRYLLQRGLQVLRSQPRPAVSAMLALSGLTSAELNETHLGFSLGPLLNAIGRLADPNLVVEFLISRDPATVHNMAAELARYNSERRRLTAQVMESALARLAAEPEHLALPALILSDPDWPAGILGIAAARLVERFGKPTVLLAAPPNELARGSARSVPGCDITAALKSRPELLEQCGGHAQAGGLSINREHLAALREAVIDAVARQLGQAHEPAPLMIDAYISLGEMDLPVVDGLEHLAPFGAGNPQPVLAARGLSVFSYRTVGKTGEHLAVTVADEAGRQQKVMVWNGTAEMLPKERFDLAFTARPSVYRGKRQIEAEWVHARPAHAAVPIISHTPTVTVVDCRHVPSPLQVLAETRELAGSQLWAEAGHRAEINGVPRHELEPGPALIIWTAPPGLAELQAVLARVKPEVVHLFGADPVMDDHQAFMQRLRGLIKYALNHAAGETTWSALAAATAQREAVVRVGVDLLAAQGLLTVENGTSNRVRLTRDGGTQRPDAELSARLRVELAESSSFRRQYLHTPEAGALFSF